MNLHNHQESALEEIQNILVMLELSEHNRKLAETYFDMEEPENQELLKEVERQDFSKLQNDVKKKLCRYGGQLMGEKRIEESGRYIRFVTAVGGASARLVILRIYNDKEYEYLEQFLSAEQIIVFQAKAIFRQRLYEFMPLFKVGRKHPEHLIQAIELSESEDTENLKIILSAIYLYCVKPSGKTTDNDIRAEDSPEQIQKVSDYLIQSLIENIDLLFQYQQAPKQSHIEQLQNFVKEADANDSFPRELKSILYGKNGDEYMIQFLSCCAFLAIDHSSRFLAFLRLTAAIDGDTVPNRTLDVCKEAVENEWFYQHIETLEDVLPIPKNAYIRWGLLKKEKDLLIRMSRKAPDSILQVLQNISNLECGFLLAQIRTGNPALFTEIAPTVLPHYRREMAHVLVMDYKPMAKLAEKYLLGEAELSDVLPYVKEWRKQYGSSSINMKGFNDLLECGETSIYQRMLVLKCLCLQTYYFWSQWVNVIPKNISSNHYDKLKYECQLRAILKLFEDEQVPIRYRMDFLGIVYSCHYTEEEKFLVRTKLGVKVLSELWKDWHEEFMLSVKESIIEARVLAIIVMNEFGNDYKKELLSFAAESAKMIREHLQAIYKNHKDWEEDVLLMLKSKKGSVREIAVQVLKAWDAEAYKEPIKEALEVEKTKKLRELMQSVLSITEELSLEKRIEEILTGGRKRILSWFLQDMTIEFPKVHKKASEGSQQSGEEAGEDYLAAILVSYADMKTLGVNVDATNLAAELNPQELAAYMNCLFMKWLETKAEAKKKWVLYAASIHGNESTIQLLYNQIQEWPKLSRGALAAEAVKALALNGSSTALLLVDQLSRKCKSRQVKAAAAEALTYAAEQLGITRTELEDRIVPNLGFDDKMEQTFDYGTRSFQVLLTTALELEVYDENKKKLKNLPAPAKKDDLEKAKAASNAFKLLKKQLKTVISTQKLRLEQAMSTARRWQVEQWKDLFVKNPVMHQFATGLIWGLYENGILKDTFRYMEDGTFNTMGEEEYKLQESETKRIGLVHPVELSTEELSAWKEQLADYEVIQPIEQLDRPTYFVSEEEKAQEELTRFHGIEIHILSLFGKLQNQGWHRGDILDAGCYDTICRSDNNVEVKLSFSGSYVSDNESIVTVYNAKFYKIGATSPDGNDGHMMKHGDTYLLSEINPRYFSEIVLQLARAMGKS